MLRDSENTVGVKTAVRGVASVFAYEKIEADHIWGVLFCGGEDAVEGAAGEKIVAVEKEHVFAPSERKSRHTCAAESAVFCVDGDRIMS